MASHCLPRRRQLTTCFAWIHFKWPVKLDSIAIANGLASVGRMTPHTNLHCIQIMIRKVFCQCTHFDYVTNRCVRRHCQLT